MTAHEAREQRAEKHAVRHPSPLAAGGRSLTGHVDRAVIAAAGGKVIKEPRVEQHLEFSREADAQILQVVKDSLGTTAPDPNGIYFVLTSADVTALKQAARFENNYRGPPHACPNNQGRSPSG